VQDGSRASVSAGVRATALRLDEELQKHDLSKSDAVLVGFSQGTMMALHVGLRPKRKFAGIIDTTDD
jgi:phospholipase/carboxylesterase